VTREGVGGPKAGASQNNPPGVIPGESTLLCVLRHRSPARPAPGLRVCNAHLSGLQDQLDEVRELYTELDYQATPGPSREEHRRGKPVASKPPLRLDVLVLRDMTSTASVDGVTPIGALVRWSVLLGRERGLRTLNMLDPLPHLARLRLQLRWVAASDWLEEFVWDLREVLAALRRAHGDRPRSRVGTCQVLLDDAGECGGALLADKYGGLGVTCSRCGDRWDAPELRLLGRLLATESAATP